ncbi:S-adenosyl-L-methionine-dependent methyltransferase [Schizopora paradoxa]|uniref:S-adenosyl-L-methionine-dependent methyltransferase n=1 Tax=Schizopora paradoxa TaxID=27342 RepID=A0A0H2R5G2_9AGAM|nr:S-adenosyl-L-methionine-dependent methyltransferase [Schizopora paradoxa]
MATNDSAYEAGDNYILPHDESELHRLNVQHKYLTRVICGQRLIYDKTIVLDKGSCVLDSGTGTGAWALDLANEVPDTVAIHAADVSPANFPSSYPPNIHFTLASITSLPEDWSNKFDFITQRFLFGALLAKEWPVALSEMYRTLKPGGAVQLIEMDARNPVPETPATARVRDIVGGVYDAHGLNSGIAEDLAGLLKSAGFVDVLSEKKQMPVGRMFGEIGMQGSLSIGGALRNMGSFVVKSGLSTEEEYTGLVEKVKEDWDTHGVQFSCRIAMARKPLN